MFFGLGDYFNFHCSLTRKLNLANMNELILFEKSRSGSHYQIYLEKVFFYSIILVTTPVPTVLPPSRIVKLTFCSMGTGSINSTVSSTVSPGFTIWSLSANSIVPVISREEKKNWGL